MSSLREYALPLSEDDVRSMHAGDMVSLSGLLVTARDAAHKYMVEQLINNQAPEEAQIYSELRTALRGGAIYHCGPVMEQTGSGWRVVAAGPTTSSREEEYEDKVIEHFGVRAIIGKGGMGPRTKLACSRFGAVYLHAIGGAAALIAQCVANVAGVWKLEFGIPEAMWRMEVADLQLLVTIDAHGRNLHEEVAGASAQRLQELLKH